MELKCRISKLAALRHLLREHQFLVKLRSKTFHKRGDIINLNVCGAQARQKSADIGSANTYNSQ